MFPQILRQEKAGAAVDELVKLVPVCSCRRSNSCVRGPRCVPGSDALRMLHKSDGVSKQSADMGAAGSVICSNNIVLIPTAPNFITF
jgi:hypothetical protein